MKKLTLKQIHGLGVAMPEIMESHQSLIGQRLKREMVIPGEDGYPDVTAILTDGGHILSPQYDDEGNPGEVEFNYFQGIGDKDTRLITGVGYIDLDEGEDPYPYIEIGGGYISIIPVSGMGPGVIHHVDTKGDHTLFCQLRWPR